MHFVVFSLFALFILLLALIACLKIVYDNIMYEKKLESAGEEDPAEVDNTQGFIEKFFNFKECW